MQQVEKSAGVDRTLQLVEVKRHAQKQIAEGHAEQQRGQRPADHQRPVPHVAPARIA